MRQCVLAIALVSIGVAALAYGATTREPIYIFGDEAFTPANGVVAGGGTADDPYIIEGWNIEGAGYDYAIHISNTTAHFIIRGCRIRRHPLGTAVRLTAVENGRIENLVITGVKTALQLVAVRNTVITGNVLAYSQYGVVVSIGSADNLVYGNSIIDCQIPARDEGRNNSWYYGGRGNYWSDYRGQDKIGDGIGDTPYRIVLDRYPLLDPPVEVPAESRQ